MDRNCLTRAPVDDLALALFRTCVFVRFPSLTAASTNKLTLDGLPTPPRDCSRGLVGGHVLYTLYLVFKDRFSSANPDLDAPGFFRLPLRQVFLASRKR